MFQNINYTISKSLQADSPAPAGKTKNINFPFVSFLKIERQVSFTYHTDAVPFVLEKKFYMCSLYTNFMISIQKSLIDRKVSTSRNKTLQILCSSFVPLYPYKSWSLNCIQLIFFLHPDIKINKGERD